MKVVAAMLADAIGLAVRALRRREADLRPTGEEGAAWAWLFEPTPFRQPGTLPWLSFDVVCAAMGWDVEWQRGRIRRIVEARVGAARARPVLCYHQGRGGRRLTRAQRTGRGLR